MHEATSQHEDESKRKRARAASGAPIGMVIVLLLSACAGGATVMGTPTATEAEWRVFATPRPTPLPRAARVSITEVQLLGGLPWDPAATRSPPELGVEELVVAGLLRRRDLEFVERRRFTQAAAAERAGIERPPGSPAAGVSPGAEYLATATWVALGGVESNVELRLTDARTGAVATSHRVSIEGEVGAVSVARSIVHALLGALDTVGRLPAWADPLDGADGTNSGSDVSERALASFMRGIAGESTWDWEGARRHYQAASGDAGFYEARAALARAARLRLGGTLGES